MLSRSDIAVSFHGLLQSKHVGKGLQGGAGLSEVPHLLVHADLDVGDARIVQRFFQIGILHLLGVAELLHQKHQSLRTAVLHHLRHELAAAVFGAGGVIEQHIVVDGGKLLGQRQQRIGGWG